MQQVRNNGLRRVTVVCANVLMGLSGAVLVGMMLLACSNMLLRAVWVPVRGTYELMGFAGALLTAFGLAGTQLKKGHIALTIMAGTFPRPVERCIDAVSNLACATFFGLVAWRTTSWSLRLVESGELSETLRFAFYPFPFAVAFGCGVLALALFCDFLDSVAPVSARPVSAGSTSASAGPSRQNQPGDDR